MNIHSQNTIFKSSESLSSMCAVVSADHCRFLNLSNTKQFLKLLDQ